MLSNLFSKARQTAASAVDAARGVQQVDWIHHAFPYVYTMTMFDQEAIVLSRPQPPAGLDQAALMYANQWYSIWESVRDGHMAPVGAIEAGDVAGATSALAQWEQQIGRAVADSARLGDFHGNRTLVLGNNDVGQCLESAADLVRTYIAERMEGEPTEDTAWDAINRVIALHTSMNNALGAFYADPTGARARAAEDAAFAPLEAMRQVDPNAPELAPIAGISLHDYVAGGAKMHTGLNADQICQILGVERPQWDQAAAGWMQRIQQYPMTVGMESGNLVGRAHPLFDAVAAPGAGAPTAGGSGAPGALSGSQAARLASDRDFYIECAAAMAAASQAGRDAEVYMEKNYRVTVSEVANAGVRWMSDMRNASTIITLQQARQAEIAERIKAETGPGLADDIVF